MRLKDKTYEDGGEHKEEQKITLQVGEGEEAVFTETDVQALLEEIEKYKEIERMVSESPAMQEIENKKQFLSEVMPEEIQVQTYDFEPQQPQQEFQFNPQNYQPRLQPLPQMFKSGIEEFEIGGIAGDPPSKKPIYVTDPKDPRLIAYQDSLMLYTQGQKDAEDYKRLVSKNNLDTKYIERWKTDGWVNTDKHKKIGAVYSGILKNHGGGFERDEKGRARSYNYYTKKDGTDVKIYYDNPSYEKLSQRFEVYKKPEQPIIFKPDPEVVAKQEELIAAGYKIGKPDGIWGPKSEAAWIEYQSKAENKPDEILGQPNTTNEVTPLDAPPSDNPISTPQDVSPQTDVQETLNPQTNTSPQVVAPQQPVRPSGYNVWTHNGQPLDPAVYGWAPSDAPRQISQFAQTHALQKSMQLYQKLGATPWATEGERVVMDRDSHIMFATKQQAEKELEKLAKDRGLDVQSLEIRKLPAGWSGYTVVQKLKQGGVVFQQGGEYTEPHSTEEIRMKVRAAYAQMFQTGLDSQQP